MTGPAASTIAVMLSLVTPGAVAAVSAPPVVLAQSSTTSPTPVDPAPNPGNPDLKERNPIDPKSTIPEKMPEQSPTPDAGSASKGAGSGGAGSSTDDTLSDTLSRTDGVLKPPVTGAPDMRVPAPVPDPNTTPVIPPPGTPGSGSNVRPK